MNRDDSGVDMKWRGYGFSLSLMTLLCGCIFFGQACGGGFHALSGLDSQSSTSSSNSGSGTQSGTSPVMAPTNETQLAGAQIAPNCPLWSMYLNRVRTQLADIQTQNCIDPASGAAGQAIGRDSCTDMIQQGRAIMAIMNPVDCTFQLQGLYATTCFDANDLTQTPCVVGQSSQTWLITQNTDQSYQVQSKATGQCLAVDTTSVSQIACSSADSTQHLYFPSTQYAAPAVLTQTPVVTTINPNDSNNITAIDWDQSYGMYYNVSSSPFIFNAVNAGAYIEYPLNFASTGSYLVILYYTAALPGAGVEVTLNGQTLGSIELPVTGTDMFNVMRSLPLFIQFPQGAVTLRFTSKAANVPYNIRNFYIAATGTTLPNLGEIQAVSPTGTTQLDLLGYASMYRQEVDSNIQDGNNVALSHVENQASIEYLLNVAKAGIYNIVIHYSTPFAQAGMDFLIDPEIGFCAPGGITPLGSLIFPTSPGTQYTVWQNSAPVALTLPAGYFKLVLAAYFDATTGTQAYAYDGVSLTAQ